MFYGVYLTGAPIFSTSHHSLRVDRMTSNVFEERGASGGGGTSSDGDDGVGVVRDSDPVALVAIRTSETAGRFQISTRALKANEPGIVLS